MLSYRHEKRVKLRDNVENLMQNNKRFDFSFIGLTKYSIRYQ